jgi:hypothetical protein
MGCHKDARILVVKVFYTFASDVLTGQGHLNNKIVVTFTNAYCDILVNWCFIMFSHLNVKLECA